jgi:hypothetical protein
VVREVTKKQVQKLCELWRRRLGLLDWSVTIVLDKDLPTAGLAEWDVNYTARISLLPSTKLVMERVLVHELVHLVMYRWTKPSRDVEATVEHMTAAFLQAYRRRSKNVLL